MSKKRIGIYSGTFDPVHAGHIAFALQAIKEAKLDEVYFLPERRPRYKPVPEHFGHRTAMLTRAIRPHRHLGILELPDIYFDVSRTLPKLKHEFPGAELVFLMGSDVALGLNLWPKIEKLLSNSGLVIALRNDHSANEVKVSISFCASQPDFIKIFAMPTTNVSSTKIRHALRTNQSAAGLLSSVNQYARAQWLYASVSNEY